MGGKGSGRTREPKRLIKDAIERIDDGEIINNLGVWARGKPVICPYCDKDTGAYTADTVALASAIELLNRKRGKVPTTVQLDITENIQFSADQIDTILNRILASPEAMEYFRIHQQALLGEVIEGEVIE